MRTYVLIAVLAALCASARAGITVAGPGDLESGATGTVSVTVTNDNQPTPARDVELALTLFYTQYGENKTQTAKTTFRVGASGGAPWVGARYQFPVVEGLTYLWDTVQFTGDGINPRVDSARVAAVDSLPAGATWTTSVKVRAGG